MFSPYANATPHTGVPSYCRNSFSRRYSIDVEGGILFLLFPSESFLQTNLTDYDLTDYDLTDHRTHRVQDESQEDIPVQVHD
jgi:hypothetical protein